MDYRPWTIDVPYYGLLTADGHSSLTASIQHPVSFPTMDYGPWTAPYSGFFGFLQKLVFSSTRPLPCKRYSSRWFLCGFLVGVNRGGNACSIMASKSWKDWPQINWSMEASSVCVGGSYGCFGFKAPVCGWVVEPTVRSVQDQHGWTHYRQLPQGTARNPLLFREAEMQKT